MPDELFSLFDPDADVEVTRHNLPHWQQIGKTYFITFRTEDSLPRAVIDAWYQDRNAWLKVHEIDPESRSWRVALARQPVQSRREFHRAFTERFHRQLDECHGECVLRRPELAQIVAESLLHFDGQRYEMGDFVVMPNHVHLLVQFIPPVDMKRQCTSWKHFTATRINRELARAADFWQSESFDHIVRSPEQFEALRRYIADNPLKAELRQGEFLHYVRGD
jgi:REP element-mobilizing transposase RayT